MELALPWNDPLLGVPGLGGAASRAPRGRARPWARREVKSKRAGTGVSGRLEGAARPPPGLGVVSGPAALV